ncbi:hypothetical protein GCM10011358_15550 [Sinisalibacter lacisalsi]|uniref:Uncharacterized protein n=1 Tax=Sinisalibacter lacisalsi TaxID=1526570 RepID=A0ABQ1QMT6_9RHOB|nr:hypothetical protein GCM10011358_15550 [Sinisalibacter lacisalsi]
MACRRNDGPGHEPEGKIRITMQTLTILVAVLNDIVSVLVGIVALVVALGPRLRRGGKKEKLSNAIDNHEDSD